MKTKKTDVSLYVVYRSPNSKKDNDEVLCQWISNLKGRFLIIGDLNYPGINWRKGTSDSKGRPFYDACSDNFIEQYVTEATHINGNLCWTWF